MSYPGKTLWAAASLAWLSATGCVLVEDERRSQASAAVTAEEQQAREQLQELGLRNVVVHRQVGAVSEGEATYKEGRVRFYYNAETGDFRTWEIEPYPD